MFRVSQHPSSGVLKTEPAVSGTGNTTGTATPLQRGLVHGTMSLKRLIYVGSNSEENSVRKHNYNCMLYDGIY